MKLTIDTDDELNAEQLYGLYVAAKKKEEQSKKSKETFNCGYNAGYAKCKSDYKSNHWSVFENGKREGYDEGYFAASNGGVHQCNCKIPGIDEKNKVKWQVKCRNTIIPGKFTHKIAEEISQSLSYNSKLHYFVIEGDE